LPKRDGKRSHDDCLSDIRTDSNPGPRKCKVRILHTKTQIPKYLIKFLPIHIFCYLVQLRDESSLQSRNNRYLSNLL